MRIDSNITNVFLYPFSWIRPLHLHHSSGSYTLYKPLAGYLFIMRGKYDHPVGFNASERESIIFVNKRCHLLQAQNWRGRVSVVLNRCVIFPANRTQSPSWSRGGLELTARLMSFSTVLSPMKFITMLQKKIWNSKGMLRCTTEMETSGFHTSFANVQNSQKRLKPWWRHCKNTKRHVYFCLSIPEI